MGVKNDPDLVEVQRLEQSLSEMEAALNEHYRDVGKSLLELAEREDKEIGQLVDQIIETRRQITILRGQVQCPSCLSYNGRDSRYCSHCGAKLQ